jgi:hypothetical protein
VTSVAVADSTVDGSLLGYTTVGALATRSWRIGLGAPTQQGVEPVKRIDGCWQRLVLWGLVSGFLTSAPGLGQGGSSMFLLDLPGESVAVRYSHGSLDRAVQVQDNFELMVGDFRGWTRTKVGLILFLLSRDEWQELDYRQPYGVPEAAGGRGIALPAWGDDGTVEVWQKLLGTRLPVMPDQPLRGTPEQVASLGVGDLVASIEAAQIMLRAAGITGDQPWVERVVTQVVVLSNIQEHHGGRLADVRMVFGDLAKAGGGPAAYPLSALVAPPSLRARLWFDSQCFNGANLLAGPDGKYPAKALFKQARKNGGLVRAADLLAKSPELNTWLQTSFKEE